MLYAHKEGSMVVFDLLSPDESEASVFFFLLLRRRCRTTLCVGGKGGVDLVMHLVHGSWYIKGGVEECNRREGHTNCEMHQSEKRESHQHETLEENLRQKLITARVLGLRTAVK
jgi:hypothetical protein